MGRSTLEVAHAWLVDPLAQMLEAFEPCEGRWVRIGSLKDDDPVAVAPFDRPLLAGGSLAPTGAVRITTLEKPWRESSPVSSRFQ
ncbi:MAG TPA: hypothetical protein VNL74_12545 [Methylococcus sp.]|nr:hypothetical protein [Methylococcus sp.]